MGDSNQNILNAIGLISEIENVKVTNTASFYLSKAWGKTDQNDFVNTVIEVQSKLTATNLLKALQQIEINLGRVRKEKWGPRIIDIDILTFAEQIIDQPLLKIPHPHICERSFVLAPLYELNPSLNIVNKGAIKKFINTSAINKEIIDTYVVK